MRALVQTAGKALSFFQSRVRGWLLMSTILAVAAGGGGAYAASLLGSSALDEPLAYGDTVVVWGPRIFADSGWNGENFTFVPKLGRQYLLKVVNGNPDGSQRLASGWLKLNGWPVLTADDSVAGIGEFFREVQVSSYNYVTQWILSPGNAKVTVSLIEVADPNVVFFRDSLVATDTAEAFDFHSVTIPSGVSAPFFACATNGNPDGSERLSWIQIWLLRNGNWLFQADKYGDWGRLFKQIALQANDTLVIKRDAAALPARGEVCLGGRDAADPTLSLTAPIANLVTRDTLVSVTGTVFDSTATVVRVNGTVAERGSGGTWTSDVLLVEGANTLTVTAIDAAGNQSDTTLTVRRDQQAPIVTITSPATDGYSADTTVTLMGTVSDSSSFTFNVNGVPVTPNGLGQWSVTLSAPSVTNVYVATATDAAGNSGSAVRIVGRDTQAPTVTVSTPVQNDTTENSAVTVNGTVVDSSAVTVTVNGDTVMVSGGAFSRSVNLTVGTNTVLVIARDAFGNTQIVSRTVVRAAPGSTLPPDPSTVAPALHPTEANNLHSAMQFLWSGLTPIQTGVAPGTMIPSRVSVLRGWVVDRAGAAVPDAQIRVVGHPEFGQTRTRADGGFDLAANGGGSVALEITKTGFIPSQRRVDTEWMEWAVVDSIVLTARDTNVTVIDFSDSVEVARGSVITDSAGTRQATLMFKLGTTAQLRMPNGSAQSISSLSVRATEFTTGPKGLEAMPAVLPPATAYTYAVELVADEAIAAGAKAIEFSQPVAVYVDNFLGFPVGSLVPVGTYDVDAATWIPEPDGRVVEIVSISGGLANLDLTGSGTAASAAQLDSLGVTTAERRQLANLYSVGKELWRVQHASFSWKDYNWPFIFPFGASKPNIDPNRRDRNDCNTCKKSGSVIGIQNQTLGEQLGIAGTPFSLAYSSDRSVGHRSARQTTIPDQVFYDSVAFLGFSGVMPSGGAIAAVLNARYSLNVAGREYSMTATRLAGGFEGATLEWNGLDAAGRRLLGETRGRVTVEYFYGDLYRAPMASSFSQSRSFGIAGLAGTQNTNTEVRRTRGMSQSWNVNLGNYDANSQGMGGWTLSAHHFYNPSTGSLYMGDGSRREAEALGQSVRTLLSNGAPDIAAGPDGTFYIAFAGATPSVQRYSRDGTPMGRVAGHPSQSGYSGEGIRADSSRLSQPNAIAIGPDGLLYIADGGVNRIRRVDADGRLRTIAGTGTATSSGDGGPALSAGVRNPQKLAFMPDGSLLFLEANGSYIRRIDPNGIISRFAGNGTSGTGWTGDGGNARSAQIPNPTGLAAGPDGTVYVSHADPGQQAFVVRRIHPSGIIETFAGRRASAAGPTPARQTLFGNIADIAVAPNGDLVITSGVRVHAVTANHQIRVIAGSSGRCIFGSQGTVCDPAQPMTRGLATQFKFGATAQIAYAKDGTLLIGDTQDNRVRAISPALPSFNENDIIVASADGGAVYQFNQYGRHLRTIDAMSRDTLLEFAYDSVGRLVEVRDADGDETTIERGSNGRATAIVGPDGHRTELTYDSNGFLATVTNPRGERVAMTTATNGLLQSMTDPRGGQYRFVYDTLGRLVSDSSAAGYVQSLSRTATDTSSTVTHVDNLGRSTSYRWDRFSLTSEKRTVTSPAGLVTTSTTFQNDSTVTVTPDGTTMMAVNVGDSRFGSQAPVLRRAETRLPSGLTSVVTASRTATLSNAADPLSLTTLLDTVRVNNRVYRSQYTRANRTLVTTSPAGRTTTTVYDSAGRVLRTKVPGLDSAVYTYDSRGRLTQAQSGGRISTFAYDAQGRLLSTTDPLGRRDSLFYDTADRLTRRVLPDGRAVTFAYDSSGNLTSVTPPGKPAHTFVYAPADRLAQYNPPTNGLPVSATGYVYNTAGQVTVLRRAVGDSIRFVYDGAGRPSSVVFDRGTLGFSYNGTTGNLTSMSAPGGQGLAFTYDGALPTSVTWSGTVSGSTAVAYNSDFRVTSQTVNGANAVSFGYDADGLLTQAGGLGLRRASNNGRLDADSITVGGATQRSTYGYDNHGALNQLTARRGTDTLFATSYVRDSLSRITQLTERVNGTTQVVAFTYDSVGRLSSVTRNGTPSASYTYDLNGNRATKTTSGGTQTAVVDDQDRLTSYGGATYQYTAHGDLRRKIVGTDTTEYTYDALGNLTRVELPNGTVIGYLLDAMNRRIGKTVNDTLVRAWLYQGQLTPVAELDGSGNVVSRFVYATGVNVPDYLVRGDSTYRIIRDHLGSVRLVVNVASGTVAQRVSYDEFGIETENTNPGWQPFGYAGGLTDSQTGLVRFGARDYDPVAGRWTAKDPIRFAGGSSSLYLYALNDPVNFLDRTGTVFDVSTSPDAAKVLRNLEATIHAMLNSGDASTRQDGVALHSIVHELREHPSVVRIYYDDPRYSRNYTGSLQDGSGVGIALNQRELPGVSDIVNLMHELQHAHDTLVCRTPPDGFYGRAIKKFFGVTPKSEAGGIETENRLRRFKKCTPRSSDYYEFPPPCEA